MKVATDSYFIVRALLQERLLIDDQEGTEAEHDEAMASITKHDGKQERKGDDGVQSCKQNGKQEWKSDDGVQSCNTKWQTGMER